ncbi:hypothetical protein GCM10025787_57560 [Saccharopolyspora rosea]
MRSSRTGGTSSGHTSLGLRIPSLVRFFHIAEPFTGRGEHGQLREGGTAEQAETAAFGPVQPTWTDWPRCDAGRGGYSQPRSSATRTASIRLRVPVLVVAPDR